MKTTLAALLALGMLLGGVFLFGADGAPARATLTQAGSILVTLPALEPGEARFMALGDIMLDRSIRLASEKNGADYPFSCIDGALSRADFVVANLEGPITPNASLSAGSQVGSTANYYFTFPTSTGALLARHNIRAVDIGNNHILNFGYQGLLSTQENLSQAGVGYFGGIDGNEGVFRTEDGGVALSFVGYNEFGGSPAQNVADEIAQERAAGRVVIVYAHWGDEYIDSSPRLRPVATLFAQAGASAVIGMHPHVVLGHEYIGSTLVYYSLGNFIFDQYWNSDVSRGLALTLTVSKDGKATAEEHPVVLNRDGTTCEVVQ